MMRSRALMSAVAAIGAIALANGGVEVSRYLEGLHRRQWSRKSGMSQKKLRKLCRKSPVFFKKWSDSRRKRTSKKRGHG
jgi:hypothetical protein